MADKLSLAPWKDLVKKYKDLKAPGVGVQLDKYQKALVKQDLLEQLGALGELLDETRSAKSKYAKGKENADLAAYLDGITKDAQRQTAKLKARAKKAQQEEEREKNVAAKGDQTEAKQAALLLTLIKRALRAKAGRPLAYAVVARSAKEGSLLLHPHKVSPDQIQKAKARWKGGKLVSRGACFGEKGKLVFESRNKPPAVLPRLIKVYADRDTKRKLRPVCREATKLDAGAKQAKEAAKKLARAWQRKVADLSDALRVVLGQGQGTPFAKETKAKLESLRKLAQAGNHAEAIEGLDRMAAKVQEAAAGLGMAPKTTNV